ncbi:peptidase C14, caspase domain-containing protein [Cytidiella melzeri]|nr:peptidase C14, caspase domain-containing protein [Cytidiella melzeri]
MPGLPLRVRTQPVRKALCIAIQYSHLGDKGLELAHAHDDAQHVQNLLTEHFGYTEQDITVLKDTDDPLQPRPTRDNIIQAMRDLVAGALSGDHLLCHASGHGSQILNLNHTEKDDLDEGILTTFESLMLAYDSASLPIVFWPVDIDIKNDGSVENYIMDDEIKNILIDGISPGVNLVLIFDCCHSGTMADLPHGHTDHTGMGPRGQFYVGSKTIGHSVSVPDEPMTPLSTITVPEETQTSAPAKSTGHVVCWSACRDAQKTYELPTRGGLFIQLLTKCISENPSQTHRELLHRTTKQLQGLLKTFNKWLKDRGDMHLVTPRPQLSSLCYQTQILEVPIDTVFGSKMA